MQYSKCKTAAEDTVLALKGCNGTPKCMTTRYIYVYPTIIYTMMMMTMMMMMMMMIMMMMMMMMMIS